MDKIHNFRRGKNGWEMEKLPYGKPTVCPHAKKPAILSQAYCRHRFRRGMSGLVPVYCTIVPCGATEVKKGRSALFGKYATTGGGNVVNKDTLHLWLFAQK